MAASYSRANTWTRASGKSLSELLLAGETVPTYLEHDWSRDWGSLVRENIGALADGGASVIAPALAIASLTIAVNMVIDNLPGRVARERGAR